MNALAVGQRVRVIDGVDTGLEGTIVRRAEPSSPRGIPFWRVSLYRTRERDIREDFLAASPEKSEAT